VQPIELRQVRPDEYEIAHRVKIECGIGSLDSLESWRKMYIENPAIRWIDGTWPIGWLLVRGTEVGGYMGNIPQVYQHRHRHFVASTASGLAVIPSFRSHSFAIMKAFMSQSSELLLATTSTAQVTRLWSMFGMSPLPGADPRTASEFSLFSASAVSRRLRRRGFPRLAAQMLAEPAAMMLRLWTVRQGSHFPRGRNPALRTSSFDERFDTFWIEWSKRFTGLVAVRSRETLNWRFGHRLRRNGGAIVVQENDVGQLTGYAVLVGMGDEGQDDFRQYYLADILVMDDDMELMLALFKDVFRACAEDGMESLVFYELPKPYRDVLLSRGPETRSALGFYFAAHSVELNQLLRTPEGAYFSLFDGNNLM
jgi:hypothetical protein